MSVDPSDKAPKGTFCLTGSNIYCARKTSLPVNGNEGHYFTL